MSKIPVVAAVPAYNSAKTLRPLLKELISQKYDGIFVLDDASTDSTVKIARSFGPKVRVIEGNENVGAGANRNRIIGQSNPAIIHFIDADMQLLSQDTPNIIRSIKWPQNTAFIGGMVRNPDGTQNPFNYGNRPNYFVSFFIGGLQFIIWLIGRLYTPAGRFLRNIFSPLLKQFPNIYKEPRARRTYWVAESNFIIWSDLFAKHGGYDPQFRYSEIEDFALKMHRNGMHGYFYPEVDALHTSWDNVLKSGKKRNQARKRFTKKHGKLIYFFPRLADYFETLKTQKRYHK
jgi:N-acetylglucosaminyl-diphospho-decaprenol L-rhamnosyltransferase